MTIASVLLPPSQFIRDAAERLDFEMPARILDLGCGEGRNSLYLASLGHSVIGVTRDLEEASIAARTAQELGMMTAHFVVGDVRHLPVQGSFDAVIATEVMHLMPKSAARQTVEEAQRRTRVGGLHLLSGYTVDEATVVPRKPRYFGPGELHGMYSSQTHWEVIAYEEDPTILHEFGGTVHVSSLARIIAQKV